MDSPTGFDDDEFFGSYDADQASGEASHSPFEFDAQAQPPTPEERAHLTRFRRPVAGIVASMALLSLIALAVHGAQGSGSQRELVAHYSSALAAPTLPAIAAPAAAPSTATAQPALVPQASSDTVPDALSALATEVWAALVPDASSAVTAATPALAVSASTPALELAPPETAFAAFFTQSPESLIKAFTPAPGPMCLRATEGDPTVDGQSVTQSLGSSPISVPMTIEEPMPAASAPAKPLALMPAKPLAIPPAKPVVIHAAKPATSVAPPRPPFSSVARFPDPQR